MIRQKIVLLTFLVLCFVQTYGEIIPADNSLINYTTIYFQENFSEQASYYELYVYKDSTALTEKVFKKSRNTVPAFWIEGLQWQSSYHWSVKAFDKSGKELNAGNSHFFKIHGYISSRFSDTRLNIKTNKKDKHAGGLISPDYARAIYNREGDMVWTFPKIDSLVNSDSQIRNVLVTKENTITFLTEKHALEIDYKGKVLWKAPFPFVLNKDTISYHHDFKKTGRGTYMVIGSKKSYRKLSGNYKEETSLGEFGIKAIGGILYRLTEISVILEFDSTGKLLWYWDSGDYLQDVDLNYKKAVNGYPNMSSHMNAFNENEEGTKIYVSFRDFSRLIKLDKKTKKVELSYGERFPSGDGRFANTLFRTQHDANVTRHNSILIFNNNGARSGGPSSVLELRDNLSSKDSVLLWKFDLNFDTLSNGKSLRGGNVVELPNSNLLVCAGALNRIFEVSRNKEVVWDAFIESKGILDTQWLAFPQYRTNWTKHLGESHFLYRMHSLQQTENEIQFNLVINNTGNEKENYQVEIVNEKGEVLHKFFIKTLNEGEEFNKSVKFKSKEKKLRLIIKPGHNSPIVDQFLGL